MVLCIIRVDLATPIRKSCLENLQETGPLACPLDDFRVEINHHSGFPSRPLSCMNNTDLKQDRSQRLSNEPHSHQTQLWRVSPSLPSHQTRCLLRVWLVRIDLVFVGFFPGIQLEVDAPVYSQDPFFS